MSSSVPDQNAARNNNSNTKSKSNMHVDLSDSDALNHKVFNKYPVSTDTDILSYHYFPAA